ncbi:metal-dependent hydrolase [Haloactinomyces albus]|uniref:Membrane-bound metal-dependent hydrolase YbcI (DUF457 family) n=1 Tax=Haloactinomyces albus TaxID=1352928 RepID=A0AAE3ZAD1_9ACTN|nr:metal-dependent hydrolase [Haloactinomyces albus]MDR7299941.1 membrane-bound metal-dependent hydrolase YbcI (DUF457 family) [Haloactinomyces albus]
MMRAGHAITGLCAGLAAAPALGVTSPSAVVLGGVVTAGAALLPDLDHPGATASRRLGRLTRGLSHGLRACSASLYAATKGPRDENGNGKHRHMTHSLLFAVLLGALVWFGSQLAAEWHPAAGFAAVVAPVLFCLMLAQAQFGHWVAVATTAAAMPILTGQDGPVAAMNDLAGPIGVLIGLGCFVHCLGDAITKAGCPFLFPIPIAGETWYEIRPPAFLRFRAGGRVEKVLTTVVFIPLAVWLLLITLAPLDPTGLMATIGL